MRFIVLHENTSYFQNLSIGEGAYGSVYKARRKANNELVAIKKFKDNTDNHNNKNVKRTILREIKMLRNLKHPTYVVSLLDQFKKRGRVHLVFEYIDRSLLDLLEAHSAGLNPNLVTNLLLQLLKAIAWCHDNNIIHRDIKPENLLVDSRTHVLKLCDFGFARSLQKSDDSAVTEYVATRWYRAPELLVGTKRHTFAVDIWPVACIWVEMCSCEPLFPGDSEIDQLYIIQEGLGKTLPNTLLKFFEENRKFKGLSLPDPMLYSNDSKNSLMRRLIKQHPLAVSYFKQYSRVDVLIKMLELDPAERLTCEKSIDLIENPERFLPELIDNKSVLIKNSRTNNTTNRKRQLRGTNSKELNFSKSCNNLKKSNSNTGNNLAYQSNSNTSTIKLCKISKKSTLLTEILNENTDSDEYNDDFEECGDNAIIGKGVKTFLKK